VLLISTCRDVSTHHAGLYRAYMISASTFVLKMRTWPRVACIGTSCCPAGCMAVTTFRCVTPSPKSEKLIDAVISF
jgi:hypothetical protein